jgi:hypothetical protein
MRLGHVLLSFVLSNSSDRVGVSADTFNQMTRQASSKYAEGLRMVFVCTVPYSILAFLAVLFMRHVPLRKQADTLKLK